MSSAVTSGLIAGVVAAALTLFFGSRPAEYLPDSGRLRMTYARSLRFAIVFFIIGTMIFAVHRLFDQPERADVHISMIILMAVLGGILILETNFTSIEYDDECIFVKSPWKKTRQISWADIASVERWDWLNMYAIDTNSQGKIYLADGISGGADFVEKTVGHSR